MKTDTREYLTAEWKRTIKAICTFEFHDNLLEEILQTYDQPDRYYHNSEHLAHGLRTFDKWLLKVPGATSVKLAYWYHDFVYNTRQRLNEEHSAEVAINRLSTFLSREEVSFIGELVLATKHRPTEPPQTREAQALVDMDLAILGESPEIFDLYEANVRKEYSWVEDEDFNGARANLLTAFLNRPFIYATPELQNSPYEARAKINLVRSLDLYK